MNSLETARREILRVARAHANGAFIRTQQLSRIYSVPEKRIREELLELAQQRVIRLSSWDGRQMRSYETWSNSEEFIESRMDGGYLRIEICPPS